MEEDMRTSLQILLVCLILAFWMGIASSVTVAQQVIDPANYITSDNTPNQPNGGSADTPEYKEIGPWFTGATGIAWGLDTRLTSQLGGESIVGRSATWITNIPAGKSGDYVLYVYVYQSPNNASNVYYTVRREFELLVIDSLRHDQRRSTVNPLTATGNGAWVPLTIQSLTVGNVFTTVGADSASGTTIMRADAIRWLRSTAKGSDIEFGRRNKTLFDNTRIGENWLDSPLGSITYKEMPFFNLGAQDLIVSGVHAVKSPGRWDFKPATGTFPLTIQPGQKVIVQVGFRPFQEETVTDTMVVESNDSLETNAAIPLSGNGINYNFILNASTSNEPHYNAPFNKLGNEKRPVVSLIGAWAESGTGYAAFPYPIAAGNTHGIYSYDTAPETGIEHDFQLPDSLNGKPGSSGYYFIEWGVIAFTSNSESNTQATIIPPFSTDTIRTQFTQNDAVGTPPFWKSIAPSAVFLTQGDFVKVLFNRPATPSGSPVLRADLLRIRKIPTGPAIVASDNVNFQNVSIFPGIRATEDNFRLDVQINSGGESLLRVDSLKFTTGKYYSIVNLPSVPFELPAINGSVKLTIKFTPDTIASGLTDLLSIYSNDTTNNPYHINIIGNGVGTNLTVEENDPTSFIYPPSPVVYPDPANMSKWQTIADANSSAGSRLIGYIYWLATDPQRIKTSYVEYFPKIPRRPGMPVEIDTFQVYAQVPAGSGNSSPRARYIIFPQGGGTPIIDTISQNGQSSSVFLGQAAFLRSDDRDAHSAGGGSGINGYIRIENDTTLVNDYYKDSTVNRARRDSFVIRADAIILRQKTSDVQYFVYPTLPGDYELAQNYPNPFNPTTEVLFSVKKRGIVDLRIYDILGREVRSLMSARMEAGTYRVMWDGKTNLGSAAATGVYFYRLIVNDYVATKKMLLLK
jgi:hypothetical protein